MLTLDTVVRLVDEPTTLAHALTDPDTMQALTDLAAREGITPTDDTDAILESLEEHYGDDRLLREITGYTDAVVCDALTVDDQRMEDLTSAAYDTARGALTQVVREILDGRTGHSTLDLPVYDDEPVSQGLYIYSDPLDATLSLSYRWETSREEWPASMREEEPTFATLNRDDGTYGDIDASGLHLTDDDRHALAAWVRDEAARQER
ncbi:hypothetical protein [Actinomyces faecalis]|uniref:hypothetical protein n=1 Tax=Actinomyces faecalis TaxID=2722820 RepID=UPI001551CAD0|nr:hypothetical protein [Actinomyces faecalis]